MIYKIALYQNQAYANAGSFPSTVSFDHEGNETLRNEYARVSDIVEVAFPPLTDEVAIQMQLDALDRAEREVRLELQQKIDTFVRRRSELQALTYVSASE